MLALALCVGCAPTIRAPTSPGAADAAPRTEAEGVRLYQAGRFAEAEAQFQAARQLLESRGDRGLAYARVLRSLAETWRVLGRREQAEQLLRDALSIQERLLPPGDREIGRTLTNLGLMQRSPTEAEATFRRAVAVLESALGPDHLDLAMPLGNLAGNLAHQRRCREAETTARRSLRIRERHLGRTHPDVGRALTAIAMAISCAPERYAESEEYFARGVQVFEEALGPGHPHLANGLVDWAQNAAAAGRPERAKELYSRALRIQEAALPANHPSVTSTRRRLQELEQSPQ